MTVLVRGYFSYCIEKLRASASAGCGEVAPWEWRYALLVCDTTTMMMSTNEPNVTPITIPRQSVTAGATAVMRMIEALTLLPLHMWAECANQSIPSLVHDLTGLSKGRISMGNLDAIRPSTRKKIEAHQQSLLEDRL